MCNPKINSYHFVWVIVDKLTKMQHFIPIDYRISMQKLTQIYIYEIPRFHGVPLNIVESMLIGP